MIKRTPPRVSASMARKRDRPAAAHATGDNAVRDNRTSFHYTYQGNNIRPCSSFHYASPNIQHGNIADGAATVSPFLIRSPGATAGDTNPILSASPLSPVPEEQGNNSLFSQSSSTSTLTFDCNHAASDSNCSMDLSGEEWLDGSSGGGARFRTVEGSVLKSVVDCNVAGGPRSLPLGSLLVNDIEVGVHSPPMKRPRYGSHEMTQSIQEYATSSSSPAMTLDKTYKLSKKEISAKKMGENSMNYKMKSDHYNGSCHVCSLGATSGKNSGFPSMASAGSLVPQRHSLFAYFQPTKRRTSHVSQQIGQSEPTFHSSLSSISTSMNLHLCRYCDKPTCLTCTRQCEHCLHRFCTFCTKVNYELSIIERILCFECDERGRNIHCSSLVRRSAEKEDCCMMDL